MSLEAMKMVLATLEDIFGKEKVDVGAINALRQAIEAAEKQETLILDRGCWERGCVAYDERDGDGVNISAERVDETAKREHEPWPSVQCVCGGTIYFKHTKREWVGLTVNEAQKFYEKYTNREELIYAIDEFLEEKNNG